MLNVKQLVQDAAKYPDLDVYLYAVIRLAQAGLRESALTFENETLTLQYGNGQFWLLEVSPQGLRIPQRVWCEDAIQAVQSLIHDTWVSISGIAEQGDIYLNHANHVLSGVAGCATFRLEPHTTLLNVWCGIDKLQAAPTDTPSNTKYSEPDYGDAQGSGINVHSQGELYPLYHMYWRGSDWLCYANHAVPKKQFKQELLALPPHDRTAFVVQYGVEIRPTKPEEKGCKSSVWPLEIREDKQRGMVFTWGNLWMPYSKEFHKFLEGRTSDQRRACIQVVGDVIA